ncbi:anti-sigma factor domain-containing protein [Bacillus spongiae]|uniref:Anti-sigma factor domain-containing protein n=1 Tax=Bacillus spongiae TaxID=2683610 RepID=A0ABU8HIR9_9BACI
MNKGIVLEKHKNYLIILNSSGVFVKAERLDCQIGEEITYTELKQKKVRSFLRTYQKVAIVVATITLLFNLSNPFQNGHASAYVSLDMNFSAEFIMNDEGQIIDIVSYNDKADPILKELSDWKYKEFDEVFPQLMKIAQDEGVINSSQEILVAMTFEDKEIKNLLQNKIYSTVTSTNSERKGKIYVVNVPKEVRVDAQKEGVSLGKYMISQISSFDEDVLTVDEIKSKSINELDENIEKLSFLIENEITEEDYKVIKSLYKKRMNNNSGNRDTAVNEIDFEQVVLQHTKMKNRENGNKDETWTKETDAHVNDQIQEYDRPKKRDRDSTEALSPFSLIEGQDRLDTVQSQDPIKKPDREYPVVKPEPEYPVKEPKPEEPVEEPVEEPKPQEPVEEPKPQEPVEEPKPEEPVEEPKPEEPVEEPKPEEPVEEPKPEEPVEEPKPEEPVEEPKPEEPVEEPKPEEPVEEPKPEEPVEEPKPEEPVEEPKPEEPVEEPKPEEPVEEPKPEEPVEEPKPEEPVEEPKLSTLEEVIKDLINKIIKNDISIGDIYDFIVRQLSNSDFIWEIYLKVSNFFWELRND